jgi:hypothetical protein
VLLAACAPEAAEVATSEAARDAPPPKLAPTAAFDAALAAAQPDADRLGAGAETLAARAAALRARAAGLAGPVVDPDTQARLEAAPRADAGAAAP